MLAVVAIERRGVSASRARGQGAWKQRKHACAWPRDWDRDWDRDAVCSPASEKQCPLCITRSLLPVARSLALACLCRCRRCCCCSESEGQSVTRLKDWPAPAPHTPDSLSQERECAAGNQFLGLCLLSSEEAQQMRLAVSPENSFAAPLSR